METTAALYARVSTPQQEQETTIESQIAAIEKYAQEQDYQLSTEHYFLDQAVSGAQLDRPGLDRLRDLAAEGPPLAANAEILSRWKSISGSHRPPVGCRDGAVSPPRADALAGRTAFGRMTPL